MDEIDIAVNSKLNEIAEFILTKIGENIVKMGGVDSGFMLRSWTVDTSGKEKIIESACPYSDDYEWGTDPHPISAEMLVGWVERKFGLNKLEARKVAYMVANKIRKHGTNPHPAARNAIYEAINVYGS